MEGPQRKRRQLEDAAGAPATPTETETREAEHRVWVTKNPDLHTPEEQKDYAWATERRKTAYPEFVAWLQTRSELQLRRSILDFVERLGSRGARVIDCGFFDDDHVAYEYLCPSSMFQRGDSDDSDCNHVMRRCEQFSAPLWRDLLDRCAAFRELGFPWGRPERGSYIAGMYQFYQKDPAHARALCDAGGDQVDYEEQRKWYLESAWRRAQEVGSFVGLMEPRGGLCEKRTLYRVQAAFDGEATEDDDDDEGVVSYPSLHLTEVASAIFSRPGADARRVLAHLILERSSDKITVRISDLQQSPSKWAKWTPWPSFLERFAEEARERCLLDVSMWGKEHFDPNVLGIVAEYLGSGATRKADLSELLYHCHDMPGLVAEPDTSHDCAVHEAQRQAKIAARTKWIS